jgi:hypothetical protein
MHGIGSAISSGITRMREASPAFDKLAGAAEAGGKRFMAYTKSVQQHSAKLAENGKSVKELIAHTKEMVSAMGEVGEAVAHATGNEEAGEKIKKKTAEALKVVATAQAIATAATEAATVASLALDAAMWPVTLTAAAIALGIAAVVGAFNKFTVIKEAVGAIGKVFDVVADAARNFFSIITFGLVDNAAIHKHKEDVEELGKQYAKNAEEAQKNVDLLEATGAKGSEVAAKRKEQLEYEQSSLENQLELETDLEKKAELKTKLAENHTAQLKNHLDFIEKTAEESKEAGEDEVKIAKTRADSLAIMEQQAYVQKESLRATIAEGQAKGENMDKEGKQLELLISEYDGLHNQRMKADKELDDKQKSAAQEKQTRDAENYTKSLAKAKEVADGKLSLTIAGSKAELDAKIADINAAAAADLNAAKNNQAQKDIIIAKQKQDIAAAQSAFRITQLQDDKTGIEAKLLLVKKGSQDEHDLKVQLADQERQIALSQANLTANQILLIENEHKKKLLDLDKQAEVDKVQSRTNVRKTEIQIELQEKKISIDAKLKLEKESLLIEKNERIASIRASGKSELEIEKEIKLEETNYNVAIRAKEEIATKANIDAKLKAELEALENEKSAKKLSHKELDDLFMKGIADKRAAIVAMHKAGLIDDKEFEKELKGLDDETTKHKQDNAKKTQAMEKKMGQEAIKLGKEVADAIFAAAAEKRQQTLDATISALEAQKTSELSNHRLTAAQKAAIEKKYHDQEAALKLKAWKADQKAKAEQAIINGLLAVTSALATVQPTLPDGIIAGALALASAGVAVGTILSKSPPKFAKGVIGLQGPGTETSDSIAAYLSRGESVITAERTKQYKPILEQIQAGVYTPLPIPMLSTLPRLNDLSGVNAQASQTRGAAIDYDKLGEAVAKALPKAKVQKLSFDKKGFSHYIISESGKLESYNNRYRE